MNPLLRSLYCLIALTSISLTGFSQSRLKVSEIEKKLTVLEKAGGNAEIVAVWKKAIEYKNNRVGSEEKATKLTAELKVFEKKLKKLESLKFDQGIIEPAKKLKLAAVAAKVELLQSEKENATLETSALNQLEQTRTTRAGLIPSLIRDAKAKLESLQQLERVDSTGDPIDKAKYQRDLATKDYFQQYLKELEIEQKVIEVGAPVIKVETRIAEQKSVYYSDVLGVWKKRLSLLKAKESASDKERIKQQINEFSELPELKEIATKNLSLLEELEEVRSSSALDRSKRRLNEINGELVILKTNQEYAKNRIQQLERAGLSVDSETGQLLRQQANDLTSDKELSSKIKDISGAYTETQLSLLKLKNKRNALPKNTEEFLSDLNKQMKLKDVSIDEARLLITEQNNLLNELIKIKTKIGSNSAFTH